MYIVNLTILHKYILGCVWLDEEMMEDSFNWVGHWALTFKNKANDTVINSFLNRYRGSEEEAADIKQLYSLYQGEMSKIMNMILFLTEEDEARIRGSIQYMINSDRNPCSVRNFFKKPSKRNMSGDNKPRSKKAKETFQEEGHLQTCKGRIHIFYSSKN